MRSFGRDSYYQSLKAMRPITPWVLRRRKFDEHIGATSPGYSLRSAPSPILFFEALFAGSLLFTLVPVLPGIIWAFIAWTPLGPWLQVVLPFNRHALIDSYAISLLAVLAFGSAWYIEARFRKPAKTNVQSQPKKPPMSFEQTLFFYATSALESITSYGINKVPQELETALESISQLYGCLKLLDFREREPKSHIVEVPPEVFKKLDTLLLSISKVGGALEGGNFPFEQVRALLEPAALILYADLPDLPKLLDDSDLTQLQVEASSAWTRMQQAAAMLEPAPKPTPAPEQAPQPSVPSERAMWFESLWRLLLNALVGIFIASLFVPPMYLIIASRIEPKNIDTLRITSLPVFFTLAMAIATALLKQGSKER